MNLTLFPSFVYFPSPDITLLIHRSIPTGKKGGTKKGTGKNKSSKDNDQDKDKDKDKSSKDKKDSDMPSTFWVTPGQQRHLRACMVCSVVQLQTRFVNEGCPNCDQYLGMAGSPEVVDECTSQVYEGLIALVDPVGSWVAKWNRLEGYVPGTYAVKVVGTVSLTVTKALWCWVGW